MSTPKILIIDDEALIQEVVQGCFEDLAGWSVITANSGQDGLDQALAKKPDAIALDIIMPGMDGITLLQHLKANPVTQDIPVILLTIATGFTDRISYAELGAIGAISKPFDPINLVEQVADFLGWTLDLKEKCP
ncbi:MAG: response regulator [Oscillatoriophycideae cyanobacterium NC_groundwater_1537_Pr4_S-0.65um_50_18]|nr:response regulator [Oscillatoriophycideae cyanobacterium NC_groundwater_1537_Pr4_S-0.65um_50_18]